MNTRNHLDDIMPIYQGGEMTAMHNMHKLIKPDNIYAIARITYIKQSCVQAKREMNDYVRSICYGKPYF